MRGLILDSVQERSFETKEVIILTLYRRIAGCFIERPTPYCAVNNFHLGYKNQSVYAVSGTSHCLFSDKYKTHKYALWQSVESLNVKLVGASLNQQGYVIHQQVPCIFYYFIITNKYTINVTNIYHNGVSLRNPQSDMFRHFLVIIRQFHICVLLSYINS